MRYIVGLLAIGVVACGADAIGAPLSAQSDTLWWVDTTQNIPRKPSPRDPMNGLDRVMMLTGVALQAADWMQTLDIIHTPYQRERNPILGDRPSEGDVNVACSLAILGNLAISRLKDRTTRRIFWAVIILFEQDAVRHNAKWGFRLRFPI